MKVGASLSNAIAKGSHLRGAPKTIRISRGGATDARDH